MPSSQFITVHKTRRHNECAVYNGNIFMLRFQHYIKYKSHAVVCSFVVNMTCTSFLICVVHCSCIQHAAHISRHIWTVCIAHVLSMLLMSLDIFRWCQHLISSYSLQYCQSCVIFREQHRKSNLASRKFI